MEKEKKDFYAWISEGAVVYICGDAKQMAKDVVTTLHMLLQSEGSMSEEDAKAYVKQMRKEHRLLMDVY